jgi:hypothetical protein
MKRAGTASPVKNLRKAGRSRWEWMQWAWSAPVRPSGRKFVLVALSGHVDETARAWPSQALLCRETSQSRRTVQQHLEALEADGWLTSEARRDSEGHFEESAYTVHYERGRAYVEAVQQGRDPDAAEARPAGDEGDAAGADHAQISRTDHAQISRTDHAQISRTDHAQISPSPCADSATPSIEEISKEEIRGGARDAAAVDNSGDARAEPGGPKSEDEAPGPPPACAVWREAEARLRAVPAWALLCRAIPDADDGEVLTLAVEAPWVGYAILAWACGGPFGAEALVGRRIDCRVRRWVQAALAERGQFTAGKPSLAAHRRDGETVRLDDPAWAAWQAARAEHPECAWLDCALPDDIEDDALVVRVGDARHMTQLLDGALDGLAAAVGLAVKPRYGGDMFAALAAQRERDPLRAVETAGDATGTG